MILFFLILKPSYLAPHVLSTTGCSAETRGGEEAEAEAKRRRGGRGGEEAEAKRRQRPRGGGGEGEVEAERRQRRRRRGGGSGKGEKAEAKGRRQKRRGEGSGEGEKAAAKGRRQRWRGGRGGEEAEVKRRQRRRGGRCEEEAEAERRQRRRGEGRGEGEEAVAKGRRQRPRGGRGKEEAEAKRRQSQRGGRGEEETVAERRFVPGPAMRQSRETIVVQNFDRSVEQFRLRGRPLASGWVKNMSRRCATARTNPLKYLRSKLCSKLQIVVTAALLNNQKTKYLPERFKKMPILRKMEAPEYQKSQSKHCNDAICIGKTSVAILRSRESVSPATSPCLPTKKIPYS
ncbi:unnamed protein product [Nesidiocoris tenuis]|uniref:Uncharacterized protein n=1 Tax=Nesidiocoris tenuis TaxID=355587 RepID=A0A6H5GUE2_9HEMI|nr:unnamed protein product [Nesidiocoris tenuis]